MAIRTYTVNLTTDASGDATGYTPAITGFIDRIIVDDTDTGAGANLTITDDLTGEVLLDINAGISDSVTRVRLLVQDNAGADISGAYSAHLLANSRVKCVIDTGGDTKTCAVKVVVTDNLLGKVVV